MSASDQMREMLAQLMGTDQNGQRDTSITFEDDSICKTYLLGGCPHEILNGTRADVGECRKTHSFALKADYERAAKTKDFYYEFDAYEHLQSFITETDRKIEVSKKRLAETQAEITAEVKTKADAVNNLSEKIGQLLEKAEQLGMEGNVDESKVVLDEVEKTKVLKQEAEDIYRNSIPASTYQQQKLRVCEVCSAYLGLHDNDCRLADHFAGKLHLGFIQIRELHEKLKKSVEEMKGNYEEVKAKRRKEREEAMEKARRKEDEERRERSRSHRDRHSRSHRSRSRDKDRHRDRRSRSRDRYRDRRRRSRSRDRRRRSRS